MHRVLHMLQVCTRTSGLKRESHKYRHGATQELPDTNPFSEKNAYRQVKTTQYGVDDMHLPCICVPKTQLTIIQVAIASCPSLCKRCIDVSPYMRNETRFIVPNDVFVSVIR